MKQLWLLLVLFCSTSYGQLNLTVTQDKFSVEGLSELEIVGNVVFSKTAPTKVVPAGKIIVKPEGKTVFLSFAFDVETKQFVEFTKTNTPEGDLIWTWTHPKPIKVKFTVIDLAAGKAFEQEATVQLEQKPQPKPDDPKPDVPKPDVPVVKLDNLSILFVIETNDLAKYEGPNRAAIDSTDLKLFFQKELPEPGGLSRVRWYDKDTSFKTCTNVFCKWMNSPPEVPGMIVGNDQQIIYKGKILPVDEIKSMVMKYKK